MLQPLPGGGSLVPLGFLALKVIFSTLLFYDLPLSATKYPSLLYSPPISCPLEVIPESALLPFIFLVGPPGVFASGASSGPPTSRLPLKSTSHYSVLGTLVSLFNFVGCRRSHLTTALGPSSGTQWARWSCPCNTYSSSIIHPH